MSKHLYLKSTSLLLLALGCLVGLIVALGAEKFDHYTSTDEFCTSCHAMGAYIAQSKVYQNSPHRSHPQGLQPGCADCHIPKGLLISSYTHVVDGAGDLLGQLLHDYSEPDVWQKQKARLAYAVRDAMRANDSITCRGCHDESLIKPSRKRGQRQHQLAQESNMTCIDCHYNLVHDEVEPRESFLQSYTP